MFKIVNNKIYINRGETATYDVKVYDVDGSPTRLPYGDDMLTIQFVVSRSSFRTSEIIFKKTLLFDIKTFTNLELLEWTDGGGFTTPPTIVEYSEDALYRYTDGSNISTYAYADEDGLGGYEWIPYELRITFPIEHEDTKDAEPCTYWYEVYALRGAWDGEKYTIINHKEGLLSPKEFIIGGSRSGE